MSDLERLLRLYIQDARADLAEQMVLSKFVIWLRKQLAEGEIDEKSVKSGDSTRQRNS